MLSRNGTVGLADTTKNVAVWMLNAAGMLFVVWLAVKAVTRALGEISRSEKAVSERS